MIRRLVRSVGGMDIRGGWMVRGESAPRGLGTELDVLHDVPFAHIEFSFSIFW